MGWGNGGIASFIGHYVWRGVTAIKLKNKPIKSLRYRFLKIPLDPPFSKGEGRFPKFLAKQSMIPTFEKGGLGGIY
jgi:hypothetical protein